MFQRGISSSRAAPLDVTVFEPVEEKPENSICRHHHNPPNFLSKNDDTSNIDEYEYDYDYDDIDSDSGGKTPERKKNCHHAREVDPQLRWRDFDRNTTSSAGTPDGTTMEAHRHYDDSLGEQECDGNCYIPYIEGKEQRTKECKDDYFDFSRDGMEADVASPTSVIPSLSASWCSNETDAGKQPRRPTSTDASHNAPLSVSLEEGWKGIMAASFGVDAAAAAAAAAAASTVPPPSEASITTSARSSGDDESQLAAMGRNDFAQSATSSASGEIWSIASDGAWVPVLGDDENVTSGGTSPSSSRNNHNPVYAALVLDSMLEPETNCDDDTEKLSRKDDDSLLWTLIGGDRYNDDRSRVVPSPPPPTREIAFDISWNDTVVTDDDDVDSPSLLPLDDGDGIPTMDGHSSSLMAASTYSRDFGIDYIDSNRSISYDEEMEENEDDWFIERPIRSEIPFGDGSTGTGGNSNSNSNDTAVLNRVDGVSEWERGSPDIAATEFDVERCIWISMVMVIGFLFLVFMFAALFYAIEVTKV